MKSSSPGPAGPDVDALLVEQCLAGDERAWKTLVRRHERLVYALARRYHLSDADAQDVFQDVFVALVKGLPRLRDGRALVGWLVRTGDRIARVAAIRARRDATLADQTPGIVENLLAAGPMVGATLETIEEQALIRLALAALPDGCRRLLVTLYYEDPAPSYAQLARRWGIPIGSLGPTRARCMERLRKIVKQLTGDGRGISADDSPTFITTARPRRMTRSRVVRGALPVSHGMTAKMEESH